MKKAKLAFCILCAGVLLMAYALFTILRTPGLLQYVVLPDAESTVQPAEGTEPPPTRLSERIESFRNEVEPALAESVQLVTISGAAPSVSVTAEVSEREVSVGAGLIAIDKYYFSAYPALPYIGRLPHADEVERGDRVMLIDEQLAISLFSMVEVIDREVRLQDGEETYRIIGVLRHRKQVGDEADASVYVPLPTLAKLGKVELRTLRLTAIPIAKGGSMSAFSEQAKQWKPGGDAYDLRKERVGATIWARYLGCGVGFALLGWLIGKYVQSIAALQQSMRRKLREQYITKLLPYLIGHIALRFLALVALAALAAALMSLLLEPINVYPEYVPQIVVEPKYLAETFWNLRRSQASSVVLRTSQVARLGYFGGLCRTAVIVTLAGCCLVLLKRKKKLPTLAKNP